MNEPLTYADGVGLSGLLLCALGTTPIEVGFGVFMMAASALGSYLEARRKKNG